MPLAPVEEEAALLHHHEGLAGRAGRAEKLHARLLHDRCRLKTSCASRKLFSLTTRATISPPNPQPAELSPPKHRRRPVKTTHSSQDALSRLQGAPRQPLQHGGGSPGEKLGALPATMTGEKTKQSHALLPGHPLLSQLREASKFHKKHLLYQLMTAERADVQNQLDVIMEGIGPTDHVPKGLSTLSQLLLYRQQLLNNPGPGPWIVADWKALRTNAGRAALLRKYQRPFTSLRDDVPVSFSAYLQKLCRQTP